MNMAGWSIRELRENIEGSAPAEFLFVHAGACSLFGIDGIAQGGEMTELIVSLDGPKLGTLCFAPGRVSLAA
jgi:hypothetical protein